MDYASPRQLGPALRFPRLFQDAVERPIDWHPSIARMLEHPQEPIFHCAPIEVFDNMQNFQDGRVKVGRTRRFAMNPCFLPGKRIPDSESKEVNIPTCDSQETMTEKPE